jgi:hypothetical protein
MEALNNPSLDSRARKAKNTTFALLRFSNTRVFEKMPAHPVPGGNSE